MTSVSHTIDSVVIIDDDPILRALAETFFATRGTTRIETASNGSEALGKLRHRVGSIDLVLCDLNMPGLDGLQFLRHLKDCDYEGMLIILSGEHAHVLETARSLAASYELNLIGALAKPFNHGELERLIRNAPPRSDVRPATGGPYIETGELRIALERGEIVPFYQPKIDVATRRVVGVEALARWAHPEHGMVPPSVFIPVSEQSGLISDLTRCIIRQSIEDARGWQRSGIRSRISVNLSPRSLNWLELPDEVAGNIDAAGLERSDFAFEITESKLLTQNARTVEILARLRMKGFELSIDDFGTGYSNIDSLREFPFTELKIDKSFVQQAAKDDFSRSCVEASVKLARNLDLRVVAEGVETSRDWAFASAAGSDQIQGFYVARPMSAEDFVSWIQALRAPRRTA